MTTNARREQVLILGNGVSRLLLARDIAAWRGEIWGCNLAYLEPELGSRLTRLTGHASVMEEAAVYQRSHPELTFEIWGGHLGKAVGKLFTCPGEFRHDSGTTLVAQALHEGRDVVAAGFDLGGPDIHSPRLWEQRKFQWVKRWREILERYGWDRVTFWGHDHMPFLKSRVPANRYQQRYSAGIPHIPGEEYRRLFDAQFRPVTGKRVEHYQGYEDEQLVKFRFQGGGATYVTHIKASVAVIFQNRGDGMILPPDVVVAEEREEADPMVRVRFTKNGYETELKEKIAEIFALRGEVVILDKPEPVAQAAEVAVEAPPARAIQVPVVEPEQEAPAPDLGPDNEAEKPAPEPVHHFDEPPKPRAKSGRKKGRR